jgi:hypothetical protein
MAHVLDIHWVKYPYPRKNIHEYLIISIIVPADIQWIIIRGYLPILVPIAIPNFGNHIAMCGNTLIIKSLCGNGPTIDGGSCELTWITIFSLKNISYVYDECALACNTIKIIVLRSL